MAVEVVIGIDTEGNRDILAIEPMQEESESTYKSLFDSLKIAWFGRCLACRFRRP